MKASRRVFGFLLCITFISSFSPLFALSNRPPQQHDEQGNFIPNPFAEGDALKYGGLFGPLPDPSEDYGPINPFSMYFSGSGKGMYVRDMGFERDTDHFTPITKARSSSSS